MTETLLTFKVSSTIITNCKWIAKTLTAKYLVYGCVDPEFPHLGIPSSAAQQWPSIFNEQTRRRANQPPEWLTRCDKLSRSATRGYLTSAEAQFPTTRLENICRWFPNDRFIPSGATRKAWTPRGFHEGRSRGFQGMTIMSEERAAAARSVSHRRPPNLRGPVKTRVRSPA